MLDKKVCLTKTYEARWKKTRRVTCQEYFFSYRRYQVNAKASKDAMKMHPKTL